jgi:hypothetical protein
MGYVLLYTTLRNIALISLRYIITENCKHVMHDNASDMGVSEQKT